jgi:hypothetical protein
MDYLWGLFIPIGFHSRQSKFVAIIIGNEGSFLGEK